MRTPRQQQNALRTPLNEVLGAEANVRLLRALVLGDTPITAGELARRTSLGRTSVYPALNTLELAGIIEFVGAGAHRLVQLRSAHPLSTVLRKLFRAEAQRVDDLISAVRTAAGELRPLPASVWIEGSEFLRTGRPGETLVCYVVAEAAALPKLIDVFSKTLGEIEKRFDVSIEIRGTTRSELTARSGSDTALLQDTLLLAGVPPLGLRPSTIRAPSVSPSDTAKSHPDLDAQARRLSMAIAAKLKKDPSLVRQARRYITERVKVASAGEQRELEEWTRILAMPASRLQRFLVEPSERATRLRQTLPFLDLLTPADRAAIINDGRDVNMHSEMRSTRSKMQRRKLNA